MIPPLAHPSARAVVATLVAVLALAGCSREFGPNEVGPQVVTSPEAVKTKLRLQLADPCYSGDPRASWTRCARWLEETAGSARTAAGALPGDATLVRASGGVSAGRDAFLQRGCGPQPAPSADAGACIATLLSARNDVRTVAVALGVPGA